MATAKPKKRVPNRGTNAGTNAGTNTESVKEPVTPQWVGSVANVPETPWVGLVIRKPLSEGGNTDGQK